MQIRRESNTADLPETGSELAEGYQEKYSGDLTENPFDPYVERKAIIFAAIINRFFISIVNVLSFSVLNMLFGNIVKTTSLVRERNKFLIII
jgi:hypothetical protein